MVQPGRMARRHPHRTANRTTGIRRPPPIRPPPVRPHQPVPELGRNACQTRAESRARWN